jgi:hypothetical protein
MRIIRVNVTVIATTFSKRRNEGITFVVPLALSPLHYYTDIGHSELRLSLIAVPPVTKPKEARNLVTCTSPQLDGHFHQAILHLSDKIDIANARNVNNFRVLVN